ncbi:MAG: aminotransferase class I/II-fold pyridoxal phosphate-dependent enzyme [Chromatiales bacterium]|nr:MAG: aminotransferase class I/II-fold pyridoxal phosphate-dependent enzyme [Chromatiales bacterium]
MSLFSKFEALAAVGAELAQHGTSPVGVPMRRVLSPTRAEVDGREVILAGTNNYLGMTMDRECIEAGHKALEMEGTGTTGSRMANGTYDSHLALEREIADLYGMPHAIVFTTGYQANLGTIATLAGPDDILIIDADSHASIYDAAKLSAARVFRFRHNDAENLDKRLGRLGDEAQQCLVVVEGIYSMLGDQAPLGEILDVTKKHGAALLVDEAHSLGVMGHRGCGLAEELGLLDQVDFITGTFSKSVGTVGGFCVSPHPELAWLRNAMRAYIFTASASPANIASSRVALRKLRDETERRDRLWANARRLYKALGDMGLRVGPQPSPIVAVMMESREDTLNAWHTLLDNGVYVNLVVPPAANLNLLRCSVSAAHTPEDIDQIIAAYEIVAANLEAAREVGTADQACAPR